MDKKANEVLPAGGFGTLDPDNNHGNGSHVWDEDGREYIDYLIGQDQCSLVMVTQKF